MRLGNYFKYATGAIAAASLVACGGGGGNGEPVVNPGAGFVVGGSVTGLASNASVVLQNSGGDDLRLTQNGKFAFNRTIAGGAGYLVAVSTQPNGQTCKVSNGAGKANSDVSDVLVECTAGTTVPTGPTTAVDKLVGRWVVGDCGDNNIGGSDTKHRDFHEFRKSGPDELSMFAGIYTYSGNNCSGAISKYVNTVPQHKLKLLSVEAAKGYTVYRVDYHPQMPDGSATTLGYQGTLTFAPNGLVCMMSATQSFSTEKIVNDTIEELGSSSAGMNCGTWEL